MNKHCLFSIRLSISLLFTSFAAAEHPRWDWKVIDQETEKTGVIVKTKPNFLWGTAWAEYQNSGALHCPHSNWAVWEQLGMVHDQEQSGAACDHWNRVNTDAASIKTLGLNAARFSIEWSAIQPAANIWNVDAIEHYKKEIEILIAAGITPMITLHHFTNPQWFDEKGSFEKEENIDDFVNFGIKIFDAFSDKVRLWCTINEPGVYVFQGYCRGVFPPGYVDSRMAGTVLKNLLIAHTRLYKALKERKNGDKCQIGIVHQHLLFKPFNEGNSVESKLTSYLTNLVTTPIVEFFKTGKFSYQSIPTLDPFIFAWDKRCYGGYALNPFSSTIEYADLQAPTTLDFLGINYYSEVLLDLKNPSGPAYHADDIRTDMAYALYPEGLYYAIKELSTLKVPMYITENGVADAKDDRRPIFFKRYLYALSKALDEGCDVRGYFYWSLMDNIEWDEGRNRMRFGLYAVDFNTKERTLRPSANLYASIVAHAIKVSQPVVG